MAFTVVDRVNGKEIRKLHSQDRSKQFGYITLPVDYDGSDPKLVQHFDTLGDARRDCGFQPNNVTNMTAPKSAYPQNQKGYRADTGGKKNKAA